MATNLVFSPIEGTAEIWTLPATTGPGVAVMQGNVPGVTLTGTGDYAVSTTFGPLTISGIGRGGVGLDVKQATVETTGTWELPVVGADGTQTEGTLVYFDATAGPTLTEGTNKPYGKVNLPQDYAFATSGVLPVKIGVFA